MADVCGLSELGYVEAQLDLWEEGGGRHLLSGLSRPGHGVCWMDGSVSAGDSFSSHGSSLGSWSIVLCWDQTQPGQQVRRRKKSFRYEVMWETHDSFVEALKQSWCCA